MKKLLLLLALLSPLAVAPVRAEITDQDFEKAMVKFLESDKGQESVGNAMQSYFKKLQQKAAKDQEERMKNDLEAQFKNPLTVDIGNSPAKGPATAKITIVEFSDFQCPFCSRGKATMDEVMKAYPNDVKLVFKHLPLPFHNEAKNAAKASMAAAKQGKFWEMHDALFENQAKLGAALYDELAKKIGLDVAKFKTDMTSKEIEDQIKADEDQAQKLAFQGTPGFVVNGVAVKGAYPTEHFKMIIDRLLGKTAAPAAAAPAAK